MTAIQMPDERIATDRGSRLITAILAILPSVLLATTLPPLWQHADSMILLLGQITVALPHYPILYPMTSWVITGIFGYSSDAVVALMVLHHVLLIAGLYYCLSAFPHVRSRVIFAVALFIGMRAYVFSHGIFTEALAFGFLVVFLGAFIRIALRGDIVGRFGLRDFGIYHAALILMCLSRVSFACLALCLPFYFIVRSIVSTDRKRLGVQASVSIAAGLAALAVTSIVTGVVLRAVGASTEPTIGRPGVYRIQSLPWHEMTAADRLDLIQRAQANAKSEFVAQIIPVLIATPEPWVGPWRAVAAMRREQGESMGTDSAMSAALVAFLETMDRRLIAAIMKDMTQYVVAHHQIAQAIEFANTSIVYYRTGSDWPLARSIPAVTDTEPAMYDAFSSNPIIRGIDALPNYVPYGLVFLALVIQVLLWLCGLARSKRIRTNELVTACTLLIAGAVYVTLSCAVNIITPEALRYTVPVSGFGWTALALLVLGYGSVRSPGAGDGSAK